MENLKNIVLLIDADNTRLAKLEAVVQEVSARGRVVVKRAYGNWRKDIFKNWEPKLKKLAIKAEQQFDYVAGKNTSDIALIIDAMQLLNKSIYDAFVIVSSDSDFTPLAITLRESGVYVIGAGETQTPDSFISSCDEFIFLENVSKIAVNDSLSESRAAAEEAARQMKLAAEEKARQKKLAAAQKAEAKKQEAARKEAERKEAEAKKAAEVRTFFGIHFKKQLYQEKKEEIVKAVLTSKTKVQVNNSLMKIFSDNKVVHTVYHRLEPIIKDLPGQ